MAVLKTRGNNERAEIEFELAYLASLTTQQRFEMMLLMIRRRQPMTAKCEQTLAGMAVAATLLVWFGLALTVFYVSRLTAAWAELGTPLSPAQRGLIGLCNFVQHTGVIVIPTLLAGTAVALWWRLRTRKKIRVAAGAS